MKTPKYVLIISLCSLISIIEILQQKLYSWVAFIKVMKSDPICTESNVVKDVYL